MHDMTLAARFDRTVTPLAPDPCFEDSILFAWLDPEGACGFAHIGQNVTTGYQSACFATLCDGAEFHTAQHDILIRSVDHAEAGMAWGDALSIDMAHSIIAVDFPGCSGRLLFAGAGQRFDYFQAAGLSSADPDRAGHFVVAGRMRGELLVGGQAVAVDALGFRDRAWGPRNWSNLQEVRWQQAIFDEELYVSAATVTWVSGHRQAFGFAVIDGAPVALRSPVIEIAENGAATAGGAGRSLVFEARIAGAGIAEAPLRHEPVYEVPTIIGGQPATQRLGLASWRGRVGMSLIEHVVAPDASRYQNAI